METPKPAGRAADAAAGMDGALDAGLDARADLVRRAVSDRSLYGALLPVLSAGFADSSPARRAVAVQLARALIARPLVGALLDAWADAPAAFLEVDDPEAPGAPLALAAYAFVREARVRGEARAEAFLRAGLSHPRLRLEAYQAIGMEDGAALLPHLVALLEQRPAIAGALGAQYALLHRDLAAEASRTLAAAPLEQRRDFYAALSRHLDRVHAVKLKVTCRVSLFGVAGRG